MSIIIPSSPRSSRASSRAPAPRNSGALLFFFAHLLPARASAEAASQSLRPPPLPPPPPLRVGISEGTSGQDF